MIKKQTKDVRGLRRRSGMFHRSVCSCFGGCWWEQQTATLSHVTKRRYQRAQMAASHQQLRKQLLKNQGSREDEAQLQETNNRQRNKNLKTKTYF